MERTQISLTSAQAHRLRLLARRRHTSMASLIRKAVDRVYPEPGQGEDAWDRALRAVGHHRSGRTDVSIEHDREIADAFRE
jgi:hypothetical protein